MVASTLLDTSMSDARNTIGCLILMPILIACFHYFRYQLLRDGADYDAMNLGFAHSHETDDRLGFAYYIERDYDEDDDDDDDILREEVGVEITFDLGSLEGNVRRFFSRMNRVMI